MSESTSERYLRYAGQLWLLQAGLALLAGLFLVVIEFPVLGIAMLVVVVPVAMLMRRGLNDGSAVAWVLHMLVSLLGITSLVGILGLYFGWRGRGALS